MQPVTNPKVSASSAKLKRTFAIAGGAAVAVLILGFIGYKWWSKKPIPRLNAPIEEVIRYVDHAGFRNEPIDKQFVYLKLLDERRADMKTAFEQKRISEKEYAIGKGYAWFGRHIGRMEKYHSLRNPIDRQKYLDKQIAKKLAPEKPDPNKPTEDEDVDRNENLEQVLPLTWSLEARDQWNSYRKALKDREEELLRSAVTNSAKK